MSCCCASVGAAAERQFSEKRAREDLAQFRTKGPGATARLLLAGIAKAGPLHGRLLDIGSGVGALTFELLERGLIEAIGVDLSSAYVAVASEEAARRGRTGFVRFVHGDFVGMASQLLAADIVTLDRASVVIQNTSGCWMNRCDTRIATSLSRIQETSGTSALGLECKTWRDNFGGIRFVTFVIQPQRWST